MNIADELSNTLDAMLSSHAANSCCITTDSSLRVSKLGGTSNVYGLDGEALGQRLDELLPAMAGLLEISETASLLEIPFAEIRNNHFTHIHVLNTPSGSRVGLVDATADGRLELQKLQSASSQQVISITEDSTSAKANSTQLPWTLLTALDIGVFEQIGHGKFVELCDSPEWLQDIYLADNRPNTHECVMQSLQKACRSLDKSVEDSNELGYITFDSKPDDTFKVNRTIVTGRLILLVSPLRNDSIATARIGSNLIGGNPVITAETASHCHTSESYQNNIVSLQKHIQKLEGMAYRDSLTDLLNRAGFDAAAQSKLDQSRINGDMLLILMLDMDNLKTINDTLGHATGDRALVATASILSDVFRNTDIVARLGGDEFVVMAVCHTHFERNKMLQRLDVQLAQFNSNPELAYPLSVSVGTAWCSSENNAPLADLINEADAQMYTSKRTKKQKVQI